MKRYSALIIMVLLIAGAVLSSCTSSPTLGSNEDVKVLVDCLSKTQEVSSMEADVTTSSKSGDQSVDIKMNMKIEDIKGDYKSKIVMDMMGQQQEMYVVLKDGKTSVYSDDGTGNFTATAVDSSQLGEMDITKSMDGYNEIINKNPEYIKKLDKNTFQFDIPKEKAAEVYSKIAGQTLEYTFKSLIIEFKIGDDGYLAKASVKATLDSMEVDVNANYLNYNKKFDIVVPDVQQ